MNINYEELKAYDIVNILEYYDFSLVFISKSPKNIYYFNYYIEELEDGTDKWLFSEISNIERFNILGQRISILKFLTKLKDTLRLNHLYIIPTGEKVFKTMYEIVTASNFDFESFPEEDYLVKYDYLTKTELVKVEEEIVDVSRFKLVLKDIRNSHDIGLDLFLDILGSFKNSFNWIASDIGSKMVNGIFDGDIELKIDSLQPSSFGIYLKAEQDMFEINEKSLGKMFELLENIKTNTEEKIEELIEDEVYSLDTLRNINVLLKNVKDHNYSLAIQSNSKSDNTPIEVIFDRQSYAKVDTISNLLLRTDVIAEEIEIEGTLVTINTERNSFNIKTAELEYKGKLSRDLYRRVKGDEIKFTVPNTINARLIKEITTDLRNNEQKVKYVLESFRQIQN